MKISADWLSAPATQTVLAMLTSGGYQAFAVGGCVRNTILNVPVSDVDITTDARPDAVVALAKKAGLKSVPTGYDHGTVTVVIDGTGFEITTFRKDVHTDGRHAVVDFADSLLDDAHRRDFTMNALYVDAGGLVTDPQNGLADLAARHVRFIDNAHDRIAEDYLRILRFFRFHAWYGDPEGGLDPDALEACAQNADGIETLSRERIGAEMRKLLAAPDPAPSVAVMGISGILARILPGAVAAPLAVLVHTEHQAAASPNWLRRLAAIGGQGAAEYLRLSRKDKTRLDLLRNGLENPRPLAELAYRNGAKVAVDVALLRAAVLSTPLPADLRQLTDDAASQTCPVTASDLMPRFQGPALGEKLKALEQDWINSGFRLTRLDLLA